MGPTLPCDKLIIIMMSMMIMSTTRPLAHQSDSHGCFLRYLSVTVCKPAGIFRHLSHPAYCAHHR